MIPSDVPPSVKLLGPVTPSFQPRTHDPPFSNQIDASGLVADFVLEYLHQGSYQVLLIPLLPLHSGNIELGRN